MFVIAGSRAALVVLARRTLGRTHYCWSFFAAPTRVVCVIVISLLILSWLFVIVGARAALVVLGYSCSP